MSSLPRVVQPPWSSDERQRLSWVGAGSVVCAYVAFATSTSYTLASIAMVLSCLMAIGFRGRVHLPLKALLPLGFIFALLLLGSPLDLPERATMLVRSAYSIGLLVELLLLPLMVRRAGPLEQQGTLFLACSLMMLAGTTSQAVPYQYLVVVHLGLLAVALRQQTLVTGVLEGGPAPGPVALPSRATPPKAHVVSVWRGRLAYLVVSLGVLVTALGIRALLQWSDAGFNQLVSMLEPASYSSTVFAPRSTLSSLLSSRSSKRILARITSPQPPHYLVGRCYTRYLKHTWESNNQRSLLTPPVAQASQEGYRYAAHPYSTPSPDTHNLIDTVLLSSDVPSAYFLPRDAVWVETSATRIERGDGDASYAFYLPTSGREEAYYRVGRRVEQGVSLGKERQRLQQECRPELLRACLEVPDEEASYLRPLAKALAGSKPTARQRAACVVEYLQTQFRYGTDTPIRGPDPLRTFLDKKPPAHCEFFATAGTLMLRTLGIPARYVTGFSVHTYNKPGGYTVVREADCHAWVEACFSDAEGEGWVVFDPTPSSAFGEDEGVYQQALDWADACWNQVSKIRRAYMLLSPRKFLQAVWDVLRWLGEKLLGSRFAQLVLLLLFAWEQLFRSSEAPGRRWLRRRQQVREKTPQEATPDAWLEQLHTLLQRFEACMLGLGFTRAPHHTLREFGETLVGHPATGERKRETLPTQATKQEMAAELEGAVQRFVQAYAAVRYRGRLATPAQWNELHAALQATEALAAPRGS